MKHISKLITVTVIFVFPPVLHETNLQHCLDFGRDVSLLVKFDVVFLGSARTLHSNLLHVGQHHAVRLGNCLKLLKQELQEIQ